MATGTDTIDITDLVNNARTTFVVWAVDYVFIQISATPALAWLNLPVISNIARAVVEKIAVWLANSGVMGAFFLNTIEKKPAQARDYISLVRIKQNLSPDASDEDYAKAEQNEITAFNNFVLLTN